jgi:hypothetical protein
MKRVVILLVLVTFAAGGLFAQDEGAAAESRGSVNNFISGEVGLITAGVRYERMLTPQISIGGVFYWNSFFIIFNELEVGAFGRFYIWNGLFAELGLGFHIHTGTYEYEIGGSTYEWVGSRTGFSISPGLGWKFDKKPGGFFVVPGVAVPITLGKRDEMYTGDPREFGVDVGVVIYCSLGYAW